MFGVIKKRFIVLLTNHTKCASLSNKKFEV